MHRLEHIKQLFEKGSYRECLELIQTIPKQKWELEFLEIKAFALQKTQDYENAMIVWSSVIMHFGEKASYYENRGICKSYLGFESALEDMNKAIQLDPQNGYRYACRGFIKDKLGDTQGSILDFNKSLELDPNNEVTWNNLGLAQEKLGYREHAKTSFKKSDKLLGIDHKMKKYYASKTNNSNPAESKSLFQEIRKIVSSKNEFKAFLIELKQIFKPKF